MPDHLKHNPKNNLKKALKKCLTMPWQHKVMACRLWWSYIYWHCLIAYVPFRFWKQHMTNNSNQLANTSLPLTKVQQLIQLSESVGRHHFIKVNCLRRSMVQKALLNRMGISSQLVIGVKKSQKLFAAHCWLTYQNQIINDSQDNTSEYITLEKIDANNASIIKAVESS